MACKRCGKCCTRFFLLQKYQGDVEEAIRVINDKKGLKVIGRKDDHLIVSIDTPCVHLFRDMADESKTFCDIYENRPEVCRLYHCLKCDDDKPAPLTATFIIDPERVGRALILERIRRAFDREISRMIDDHEPSTRIEWLQALRDEVLGLIK